MDDYLVHRFAIITSHHNKAAAVMSFRSTDGKAGKIATIGVLERQESCCVSATELRRSSASSSIIIVVIDRHGRRSCENKRLHMS